MFNDSIEIHGPVVPREAILVLEALERVGISAFLVLGKGRAGNDDDQRPVQGLASVWVERATIERSREVIFQFQQDAARLREMEVAGALVDVKCKECGKLAAYRATLRRTNQDCPNCRAFVYVEKEPERPAKPYEFRYGREVGRA